MGLFQRLTANDDTKIPAHAFSAFFHIWLADSEGLGSTAGTRVVSTYSLDAAEIIQANAIKTKYDALGVAAQAEFIGRIHHAWMLAESGDITESELETLLGFS